MSLHDTAPGSCTTHSPAPLPLRHNRDWRLLMTGQTVSVVGNGMTGLAMLLLGVELTGSAARGSLVAAAVGAGQLAMMLPAGALADRWDRRRVMVWSSVAAAAALGTVGIAALTGHLTWPHLLAVALVEGMLGCFYAPAERAAVKTVVAADQLGTAAAATQARSALGAVLGSPLAGVLFQASRTLPLTANALTYLWAAGCAALVRTPLPAPARTEPARLVRDVREGLAWLWRTAAIRDVVCVAMLLNLGVVGTSTLAVLSLQQGGTAPARLGLVEAAAGVAGIAGAALAAPVVARVRIGWVTLASMWALVALAAGMTVAPSLAATACLFAGMALAVAPANAGLGAYSMRITPDAMQGRSGAATGFACLAMVPVATASAGFLLAHLGRGRAMLPFVVVLALAATVALASRPIRSIPRAPELAGVAA